MVILPADNFRMPTKGKQNTKMCNVFSISITIESAISKSTKYLLALYPKTLKEVEK